MAYLYTFYGWFQANKTGKTGLTPTADVCNSASTLVVTAGNATWLHGGLYKYDYSTDTADDYTCIFKTADATVDAQHVPALATKQLIVYLDAAVSSRSSHTAADVRTALGLASANLDTQLAGIPALVWSVATSTLTGVGTIGKYVVDMVASLVSSLSGSVTIVSPVSIDGKNIQLVSGDDYSATDGRSLDWVLSGYPSLVGSTITFTCGPLSVTCTAVDATHARVELTAAQTATLEQKRYPFQTRATLAGGRKITFARGMVEVR